MNKIEPIRRNLNGRLGKEIKKDIVVITEGPENSAGYGLEAKSVGAYLSNHLPQNYGADEKGDNGINLNFTEDQIHIFSKKSPEEGDRLARELKDLGAAVKLIIIHQEQGESGHRYTTAPTLNADAIEFREEYQRILLHKGDVHDPGQVENLRGQLIKYFGKQNRHEYDLDESADNLEGALVNEVKTQKQENQVANEPKKGVLGYIVHVANKIRGK